MKLSISNIAWSNEFDSEMYEFLKNHNYCGLEIAPTRIFPQNPYEHIKEAKEFASILKEKYKLSISSIQSIWYGISENIFGTEEERNKLISYTRKAIDFSKAIDCNNIVFGCPKNRVIPDPKCIPVAIGFFKEIGKYAESNNTTIAIEPNPVIYNTNFINTTIEAINFCRIIDCSAVKVNVDLGTVIHNNENFDIIKNNLEIVNHIHVSEPLLAPIEKRALHCLLKELDFNRYISIEMKNVNNLDLVKQCALYIKELLA